MPEALAVALAQPGLIFVAGASLLAGLVYGFAGFGPALIFMPLATIFLSPAVAIAGLSMSALASLVTIVPGAWRVADRRTVIIMIAACVIFTPLGVALLRFASADAIRTGVSVLTLATLVVLLAGWRVPLQSGWPMRAGVGALAGITGGSTGINGPPVILFNLGADQPVAVTRGNLAVFLTLTSLSFLPQLWLQGLLQPLAIWIGVLLLVPYGMGTFLGARLFNPDWASGYKVMAYLLIGVAAVAGLPIWGG